MIGFRAHACAERHLELQVLGPPPLKQRSIGVRISVEVAFGVVAPNEGNIVWMNA